MSSSVAFSQKVQAHVDAKLKTLTEGTRKGFIDTLARLQGKFTYLHPTSIESALQMGLSTGYFTGREDDVYLARAPEGGYWVARGQDEEEACAYIDETLVRAFGRAFPPKR